MNPIIEAIDAGHFERTVKVGEKETGSRPGEQVCRKDGQPFPCSVILAARVQAGPPRSDMRKPANTPMFLPPKPFGR